MSFAITQQVLLWAAWIFYCRLQSLRVTHGPIFIKIWDIRVSSPVRFVVESPAAKRTPDYNHTVPSHRSPHAQIYSWQLPPPPSSPPIPFPADTRGQLGREGEGRQTVTSVLPSSDESSIARCQCHLVTGVQCMHPVHTYCNDCTYLAIIRDVYNRMFTN